MKRRNTGSLSPQARYYLRELDAGTILPDVVERRIREIQEEVDDLSFFGRDPQRVGELTTLVSELRSVLERPRTPEKAVAAREAEARSATVTPSYSSTPSAPRPATRTEADVTVGEKTHDGFRLDPSDREEIASLVRQVKSGKISRHTLTETVESLQHRLNVEKNKDKITEFQTRLMLVEEALWITQPVKALNRGRACSCRRGCSCRKACRSKRRNSDADLRELERKALEGDTKARAEWLRALARSSPDRLKLREKIIEAMARCMFVNEWANSEERNGRGDEFGGQELMDLAPPTIPYAYEVAEEFAAEFENVNGLALDELYVRAAAVEGRHDVDPTPEDFGHYTATDGLGLGVGWGDDHPDHGFTVPHFTFHMDAEDYGAESVDDDDDEPVERFGLEPPEEPGD